MTQERDPKPAQESTAAATSTRQRRKRKWDQPAESLISAGISVAGTFPLSMCGIVGVPLPETVRLPSSVISNSVAANSATVSLLLQSSSISQNSNATIQKISQPKIPDELIAREIVINDAEPTIRYKLTKRQTQEEIQRYTGAVVITRGKYQPPNVLPGSEKPLYLHISAGAHSLEAARNLAENLLDTISAECGASRISSCYTPSPAPNRSTGSDVCPPGTSIHSGGLSNYGNPSLQVVSYTYPSVSGGTYYSGYGGIYPQATPLQQVALALRKAPAQTTPGLVSTACATISSTASAEIVSSNMTSSSSAETEKRRQQRRKFQEMPVVSNETATSCQNFLQASECLKPGLQDSNSRNISSMPPPKKLIHKVSDGMPPPPPRIMPPPPPKFDALRSPSPSPPPPKFAPHRSASHIEKSQEPGTKKPNDGPVSDTLLKLVDYGEDDDDDDIDVLSVENFRSNVVRKTSSKPFWAV